MVLHKHESTRGVVVLRKFKAGLAHDPGAHAMHERFPVQHRFVGMPFGRFNGSRHRRLNVKCPARERSRRESSDVDCKNPRGEGECAGKRTSQSFRSLDLTLLC